VVNEGPAAGASTHLDAFIEAARGLRDEDRVVLANERRRLNEVVRAASWKAANEVLGRRGAEYSEAWIRMGPAFVPDRLEELHGEGSGSDPAEIEAWQDVARLARIAMDEALVALLTADTIPPPDIRELLHPWKQMQAAAYERGSAG
jgi:hypothetical protein